MGRGKSRKQGQAQPLKVKPVAALQPANEHAAGLDIGAAEIFVAVPEGRDVESVRKFETFTVDLYALADWLAQCKIETVAMESTGVYWVPVYEILEERGFSVHLVNARHVHQTGSPKSDVLDCQKIQQLHRYGLLRGSFHPVEEIRAIRSLVRHRSDLIELRSAHIQHMQKALHLMNLQLTNVLADITGTTGLGIIRAILDGERDPLRLAQFRDPRCRKSKTEIAKSLEGNYKPEQLFALRQSLELYDTFTEKIAACDAQLEQAYAAMAAQIDPAQNPPPPAKPVGGRKHAPPFDLHTALYRMTGVDFTQIDGMNVFTVQTILSETGLDLTKWPTVKHYTAWLGVAPQNAISGGKVLSTHTKKVKSRANLAFRQAAQSLANSQSELGNYYRRMRTRFGPAVANGATAHKLARIFYTMLKTRQPYKDPGLGAYEQKYKQQELLRLQRKAKQLGLVLVPSPITDLPATT